MVLSCWAILIFNFNQYFFWENNTYSYAHISHQYFIGFFSNLNSYKILKNCKTCGNLHNNWSYDGNLHLLELLHIYTTDETDMWISLKLIIYLLRYELTEVMLWCELSFMIYPFDVNFIGFQLICKPLLFTLKVHLQVKKYSELLKTKQSTY